MPAQKRPLDKPSSTKKAKKFRTNDTTKSLPTEEVDFPRGGGTTFTPLEVKAIRAEAVKEANAELFEDIQQGAQKSKKRKRKTEAQASHTAEGKDRLRIEHLNYKRINVGMKILGQVIAILPLALIISLPNQLFAHVPITNISVQFTEFLESMESQDFETNLEEDGEEEEENIQSKLRVPELSDMFKVGQYVRAVVSAVHPPGASDTSGIGRSRDEASRVSKRVELCLIPERVNFDIQKSDLKSGFTLTAAVKSQEDHGYILDFGIPDIWGFLPFNERKDPKNEDIKLHVGALLDVTVTKVSGNGRTCTVSADHATFTSSYLSDISSASSILPGTLVQALVTASHSTGINLLVLGYFEGTIDPLHLPNEGSSYKVGKKIKARILYHYSSSSPPKFALALTEHVVNLQVRQSRDKDEEIKKTMDIQDAYPIGTLLEAVKVLRIEPERGLIVEVELGLEGFVHISHASDDHIPSLSAGHWKSGSVHQARVTGYFALDGLLQLSLKPSVIQQKYFQVTDVEVGEVIKGTVKKLTDSALFVSLSGGIDGVVWPNHYADITLKHPAKRFQVGASIKCRVLVVDPDRKRISLTAKKSLLDSSLPIFSKIEDFAPGMVTHAVVFKVHEKYLLVEFFNNLKAIVPAKEISDSPQNQILESIPVGRVVRVRMLGLQNGRITASIRQVVNQDIVSDISSIEIGHIVEGSVSEIHKDNAVVTLQPSHIRALLSLKNLANYRGLTLPQLRTGLKVGENMEELVVVTRNAEKAFVIVANKPKPKAAPLLRADDPQASNILDLVDDAPTSGSEHDNDDRSSSEKDDDSMDVDIISDEAQMEYHPTQASSIPKFAASSSLPLAGGFHWSGDVPSLNEDEAGSSSDESDDAEKPSKKKRKRKEIEQDLTSEMHTKTPESNADFERLLLGSPNSSYLWIQYMSFQLPLSELDKAREIARRAIQTINFREEKERLNVWIALLNLENVYGTEDSLQAVFKEAARANDSKTVHLRLASILDQAEKLEQAEEQYKRTWKKFGQSSKVWTLSGEYYLRRGNMEEARKLLPRSLQSLEKRKHLKTISRFAQLEYKYGDPERGKTLFEGIVDSHPKRWDMWSVYVDMEATQGNIQASRSIFDRVLAFKMTSHKAKSFFKKWFELEKRIGDEEGTENVKTKAIEWTQRASNVS